MTDSRLETLLATIAQQEGEISGLQVQVSDLRAEMASAAQRHEAERFALLARLPAEVLKAEARRIGHPNSDPHKEFLVRVELAREKAATDTAQNEQARGSMRAMMARIRSQTAPA